MGGLPGRTDIRALWMNPLPLVTIAVPVLNGERFLAQALRSAVAQRETWPNLEIVVADNASTDATPEIAAGFAGDGVRLLRFRDQVPMGASWNRAMQHTSAPFIVLLHADDILAPGMIARACPPLIGRADIGYGFGACRFIDAAGRATGHWQPFRTSRVFQGTDLLCRHARGNLLYCPTVILRRRALEAMGSGFRADLRHILDWEMWLRLEAAGWSVAYTAECQAAYRVHPANNAQANSQSGAAYDEEIAVLSDLVRLPALSSAARSALASGLAAAAGRELIRRAWTRRAKRDVGLPTVADAMRLAVRTSGLRVWASFVRAWLAVARSALVHSARRLPLATHRTHHSSALVCELPEQ